MTITTINPATGAELRTYESHDDAAVEDLLTAAHAASLRWAATLLEERVRVVSVLAKTLRDRKDEYAALITAEMGKPITEARAEIEKCAVTADYYATQAPAILADHPVDIPGTTAWVAYEPMGLVYAVMPWNFPFWQAMRFALPALAAGNSVFLKHSPNVSGSALALQEACTAAGVPEGVFTSVLIEEERVPEVSDRLVADDRIAAVTLTGSNRAGEAIGAAAGRATKRAVLELGGSDAFVVLADADLEKAAATAVRARFNNTGQSCVCAKRFIVEETVAEEFLALFVKGVEDLTAGAPTDDSTQLGPMARDDLRAGLLRQIEQSVASGAVLETGGHAVDGPGYYVQPTVLSGTAPGMVAFDEETFGPVAAVAVARDADHAAELAASTVFGLGLSIWTADLDKARALASKVTTGAVFINAMVASDARLPFGGTKRSGYGRELADVGLREFVNTRTYWAAD